VLKGKGMKEYVNPEDGMPELGIPKAPEKSCGSCCNGYITNAGACIPGYACKLVEYLAGHRKIASVNPQMDRKWQTCKFHNIPMKSIKDLKGVLFESEREENSKPPR
jgi:hypothetical protein